MYFAIRVAVGSAIMLAFYFTRGFGSYLETFVMAFAASLAAQGVALGVKMIVGHEEKSKRAVALLGACVIAFAAAVVFVVIDKQTITKKTAIHGVLDMSTAMRNTDTLEFTIDDRGKKMRVRYQGLLPDTAKDRMEIAARGQWQGDVFIASELSTKCPTTYNTEKGPVPASQFK